MTPEQLNQLERLINPPIVTTAAGAKLRALEKALLLSGLTPAESAQLKILHQPFIGRLIRPLE